MDKPDIGSSSSRFEGSDGQIKRMLRLALNDSTEHWFDIALDADEELLALFDRIMTATTVSQLQDAKTDAKGLVRDEPTPRVLYHLAVAVAITRFQALISRTPREKRVAIYSEFSAELADNPAGIIFRDALASGI